MNAYKHGFCDALFYRPCKSPFPAGWEWIRKTSAYIDGYMKGEAVRRQKGIKPLCENQKVFTAHPADHRGR